MNFSLELIKWYQLNKRDLPWRDTNNPYKIWLSEIILQQTRVAQGLPYYLKFINKYPNIQALAGAEEEKVLKLWQGLGYYSRARNMLFTAKYIVDNLGGKFPNNYKDIKQLKGIGEYTAAAISSFAYQEPVPVIDGNVMRVISRYLGITEAIDSKEGKQQIKEAAHLLADKENISEYNQSIMEFGALQCSPKPKCENCILNINCVAYNKNFTSEIPFKSKKIKQKNRYFHYIIIFYQDKVWINKRVEKGIWHNLYDFPLIETQKRTSLKKIKELGRWKQLVKEDYELIKESNYFKHVLSHQVINAKFVVVKTKETPNKGLEINKKDIFKYPLPKLIENFLANHKEYF